MFDQRFSTGLALYAGAILVCGRVEGAGDRVAGRDIVVTATRTGRSVYDVPASVDVIDADEIDRANPVTVDELFKGMTGVDLQGSGFPGSRVRLNMRGLTPGFETKRVLVMVDGRRINDQFQGNAELSLLPADGIDRVEVLKGPASALYGSSAMAGVVNVVTRRGATRPGTDLKLAGGSHNTRHGYLAHGGGIGNLDYFLTAGHVSTDGYTDNSDGTDRDWSAQNLDGNIGLNLGDNSELRLFLGGLQAQGTDENSDRDSQKNHQGMACKWAWDGDGDTGLTARFFRNGERHVYDWKYPGVGIYRQYNLEGDLQQALRVSDANLVTVGVEGNRDSVDVDDVMGVIREHGSTIGLYCQDELRLGERMHVVAGARDDYNTGYGSEISPRLGVLWRAREKTGIFASVNRAHRAPSLSDRYVKTEYGGRVFEGNPDLDPETLTAYELGMRHGDAGSLKAEVVFFYDDMDDSFDFMLESDGVFRIRNVTRARTYGFESSLRYSLSANLAVAVNYSRTDGEYAESGADPSIEGNTLAYLARHKANCGIDYAGEDGTTVMLQCRYVGSRYGDAQNTAGNEMDGYVAVDCGVHVPVTEDLTVTVDADNLFDAGYEEFPGTEQPGLIVLAGIKASF